MFPFVLRSLKKHQEGCSAFIRAGVTDANLELQLERDGKPDVYVGCRGGNVRLAF